MTEGNGHSEAFTVPWDGASSRVWRRPTPPSFAEMVDERLLGWPLRDKDGKLVRIVDVDGDSVIVRDGGPIRMRVPRSELANYRMVDALEWTLATMVPKLRDPTQ